MMIEALASGAKMIEDLEVLQAGAETIILAVVGIGLSLLSASKLKKKPTSTLRDEAPTSLATRGAPLPLLIGVDRVGPIFGWAGGRFTRTEELGGKKGKSGGGSTTIYYERGWHQLVMGPTTTLYEIRRNGELIFQGPIDRPQELSFRSRMRSPTFVFTGASDSTRSPTTRMEPASQSLLPTPSA